MELILQLILLIALQKKKVIQNLVPTLGTGWLLMEHFVYTGFRPWLMIKRIPSTRQLVMFI